MRATRRTMAATVSVLLMLATVIALAWAPAADAQDIDEVVAALESQGWYIEPGAEGSATRFGSLAEYGEGRADPWYFVSMAGPVGADFAETLRNTVRPQGNVIVYFFEDDQFISVQFESGAGEDIDDRALAPFDEDWNTPDEFMRDVVDAFEDLTATTTSTGGSTSAQPPTTTTTSSGSNSSDSGGSGAGWLWIAVPVVAVGGGVWYASRRSRKKAEADELETAQKIREALQTELDELANDVIVLSGPVDLSEDETAITHYREATATYTAISDELPDLDAMADADPRGLAELGARVAHARWQMDAAEAIIDGEPIPEKPKVEPPPEPPRPAPKAPPAQRIPQQAPRPRVPYSSGRRRSGGGLLDILIAGSGMLGGGSRRSSRRRGGGMFGGGNSRRSTRTPSRSSTSSRNTRSSRSSRSSNRRRGGGVFGGGSSSRGSSRRSSSSRSSSRTRSRSSSSSNRRSATRTRRRRR